MEEQDLGIPFRDLGIPFRDLGLPFRKEKELGRRGQKKRVSCLMSNKRGSSRVEALERMSDLWKLFCVELMRRLEP